LSTARGRVGYAFDWYLVFATAGAAFGDVRANFCNGPISRSTEAGWTIGASIEVALGRNWSAKAEYLCVDLADGSCTTAHPIANPNGPALVSNVAVKFDESIVRAGVNYRFGL